MKLLPQITKRDFKSLSFRVSIELAAGAVLTALLIRWAAE